MALVKVDTQVTDRGGRPIARLAAPDFQVLDEGAPRPIVHFGYETEPLDLILLLDVSGSMRRSLTELGNTARAALTPLGPQDRVAVILFARASEVREELTSDIAAVQAEIRDAVKADTLGSGTVINANIIAAARYAGRQPVRGRRAVLIVTDNQSLNYKVTDEDVVRELYAADAVLYAILIGKHRRPDVPRSTRPLNPDFTPSDVFKLAEQTGGEAMESHQAGSTFQQMVERIRSRYSIAYEAPPATGGGFRHIRVALTGKAKKSHPDAVIRARAGYFAAK